MQVLFFFFERTNWVWGFFFFFFFASSSSMFFLLLLNRVEERGGDAGWLGKVKGGVGKTTYGFHFFFVNRKFRFLKKKLKIH